MEYISEAYVYDLKQKVKKLAAKLAAERDEKTALMTVLQAEREAHEAKSESMKRIRSVLRGTILKLKYMESNSAVWQQRSNKFQSHLAEEREAHEATKRELAALKDQVEKAPVRWLLLHPDGYTQLLGWLQGVKAEGLLVDISDLDGKRVKVVEVEG